jgi:HEPN domain-containing protein
MMPLDHAIQSLIREWLRKADADLGAAELLAAKAPDGATNEIVAFHCQQAAEKYIKAFLTLHQVEFPKTHKIADLLKLVSPVDGALADSLLAADWLSRFGVDIRCPGDFPELLPGDEAKALALAKQVRQTVLGLLSSPSTPVSPASQIDRSKPNELK